MLGRVARWVLYFVARWVLYFLLFFCFALFSGGIWLLAVPVLLAFGWLPYLLRTLPEVSIAGPDLVFAVVCLATLGLGVCAAEGVCGQAWRRSRWQGADPPL
ncbi:MAG: hypothetical protein JRJ58_06575 [Deltaproteobacteria bacterium]|nr:hypothetical protein [Deltaproteobacteria bacterium]